MKNKNRLRKASDKLFGGLHMSWPVVILFALGSAVLTSLFLILPIFSGTAFRRVGETPEAWVLPAVIIMSNCKKPLESALKTFVFFLVSQPLIYLFQVPFSYMGWELFKFYPHWFVITLFTFPAAFVGWYITKKNLISMLIFFPVFMLLAVCAYSENILICVFCVLQIIIYMYAFFPRIWQWFVGAAVSAAAVILMIIIGSGIDAEIYTTLPDDPDFSEKAVIELADKNLADVSIASAEYDTIRVSAHNLGSTKLTVKDNGKTYVYTLNIFKDEHTTVIQID